MINPQPINERRSPYSAALEPPALSTARPSGPIPTPIQAPLKSTLPGSLSPRPKRKWKRVLGLVFLTLIAAGGSYAYATYRNVAKESIIQHEGDSSAILGYDPNNAKSTLNPSLFKQVGDGRYNIVVVGVGGDNHPGAYLTDSIQVFSFDTINQKLVITSVPRDTYVNIPNYGRAKINAAYSQAEGRKAGSGPAVVRQVVGDVLGIKITNFALIDFSGIRDVVDSLGGIDVNVPKALYDPLYPDERQIGYSPLNIKAGLQKMDGATALKYSRSRETTSDFDRSKRQQIVIAAIKTKALSAGILANPIKVTNLINTLGKHFKTDVQLNSIKAIIDLYRQITPENTTGHTLDTSASLDLLTSVNDPVAGYIAYPRLGYDKYDEVWQWFQKNAPDPLLAREKATVTLINGGKATEKQMTDMAAKLKDYGYTVTVSSQKAPTNKKISATAIYAKNPDAKPFSHNYLESMWKVTIQKGTVLDNPNTDYELVYYPSTSTSTASPSAAKSPTPTPTPKP